MYFIKQITGLLEWQAKILLNIKNKNWNGFENIFYIADYNSAVWNAFSGYMWSNMMENNSNIECAGDV